VLRKILGAKYGDVRGNWINLHGEKGRNLHSTPNIMMVIKSWRMRWAGKVACIGGEEKCI